MKEDKGKRDTKRKKDKNDGEREGERGAWVKGRVNYTEKKTGRFEQSFN